MKTMILDTSSQKLIISFIDNGKVIYNHISDGKNNHSDYLIKYISEGLDQNGLNVDDFDRIICGIGPGAYTGLRISLCVGKVFSWTKSIPLYTISSLSLLASGVLDKKGIYAINLHAKQGYVYHKIIKVDDKVTTLVDDSFMSVEEASCSMSKYEINGVINNDTIDFNGLNISDDLLTKVDDVFFLEPNYLREGM